MACPAAVMAARQRQFRKSAAWHGPPRSGALLERRTAVSQSKRGFTLIELLVVIAIIAILAAILFPVFARAREQARSSSCLSNTKQTTLGVLMYVQDYDETFLTTQNGLGGDYPGWDPYCGTWVGFRSWARIVQPYVKNKQIFTCPSAPANFMLGGAGVDDGMAQEFPLGVSYLFKHAIAASGDFAGRAMKLSEYPMPANVVLIHEVGSFHNNKQNVMTMIAPELVQQLNLNVGWMDGHSKYTKGGQFRQARVGSSGNAPYGNPPQNLDLNWLVMDDGNWTWDPSQMNARDID